MKTQDLNQANKYEGKLSQAAINTFKDIAQSIHEAGMKSRWDKANQYMKEALLEAKQQSSNKKEFLVNAKKATGLLKNTDPLLVWCVEAWFK